MFYCRRTLTAMNNINIPQLRYCHKVILTLLKHAEIHFPPRQHKIMQIINYWFILLLVGWELNIPDKLKNCVCVFTLGNVLSRQT